MGGAPISERLIQSIKKYSFPVFLTYGMTETASHLTCLHANDLSKKSMTSGKCLPFREVSIFNEEGEKLLQNYEGEIAVCGKVLFRGYLNSDKNYNSNTWFKTGDMGYLDDDGCLVLKGRKDELINSVGENIYPTEIENTVKRYSGIIDCCVLGVENSQWGQRPVLFVEIKNPSSFNK